MTVVFALCAALSNAFNLVAQHRASTGRAAERRFWQLVVYLVSSPLWLLGGLAAVGAFVFQALALHDGQLSVVQPLLVTELVFALVLRQVWIHQRIARAAWAASAVTCVSLALFVAVAEPQDGHGAPTSSAWVGCSAVFGALALASTLAASVGPPARRAGLYAAAAGTVWALEATFIKATTDTLSSFGFVGTLTRWPLYALIVGGIAGTFLVQAALHVGPLRVSQPIMVAVDPTVSIILGVALFGEHFTDHPLRVALAVAGFLVMVVGVVWMCRSAPADLAPGAESSGRGPLGD